MAEEQQCLRTNILSIQNKIFDAKHYFNRIPQYSYENIEPNKWYPMKQFTILVDQYEDQMGPLVLKSIGTGIIPEMLEAGVMPKMPPQEFIKGLSHVYHSANRGTNIGDWKVLKEEPNHIIMENSTMHNCKLEEGVLLGGIEALGGKNPRIFQRTCVKKGDSFCTFDIYWQ